MFGGTVTALLILALDFEGAVESYAIVPLTALFVMQVPILRSYLRLRGRGRPERVSRRHMRRIEVFAGLQGVIWAVAVFLALSEFSPTDGLVMISAVFVWAYSSAAAYSTMPITSTVFVAPMVAASFLGMLIYDIADWGPLLVLFSGTAGGLIFIITKNGRATRRSVALGETVKRQKSMMESVSGQLSKYISPKLYQKIFSGEQQVEIVAKRKKLTVFFSDVVGFTEITEQLESEQLTALLNSYLTEMAAIAAEYGATVDKYIGDAIVLYFGDPDSLGVPEDAEACVRMAIAMQRRVRELGSEWRAQGVERPFDIRVGINTGYCTVGNFGSEHRMDYTIIGSEVNLAARLESSAEVGGILLSNETHSLVEDWLMCEPADAITVKGFPRPITTFRVMGIYDDLHEEGRVFHSDVQGLRVTVDTEAMGEEGRAAARATLEAAISALDD
ncbi:MAG: adenylate/guanylate cyclase domain-containing protein [Acidimicrobiia bacterium]|nr:adenylate/guanylate cyclase domain-containing protein [Acidimicrobiia bacterium]